MLEFLNTFSHPHMKYPYGIAIHRDNVYVTDIVEHSVFHFKVEAGFRLVAKLGGRGSGIEQFDEPRQLAVSINGDVFVTDRYNNRVQILDDKLQCRLLVLHFFAWILIGMYFSVIVWIIKSKYFQKKEHCSTL